jgi:hypothetical protein
MARRWLGALGIGAAMVVLSLAALLALGDWGTLPRPLFLAACLAGLMTVTGMGAIGYRLGREAGRGVRSSVWRGFRMMFGAAWDIF